MFDRQIFVERMLESENLTDELQDEEARWLIRWGIAQLDTILAGIEDPDISAQRASSLMHLIQSLNRMAGNPASVLPQDLADLLTTYSEACGASRYVNEDEMAEIANKLSSMAPQEMLEFLTCWVKTGE